ncbi:PspC domain-containing protein [Qipengyuania nanhaisediminis]|uniref:PspC domain-containing protein n=1 Tax=Qipengyuania nanhaisediminis TaxID=604088 RepID=UPI0038B31A00
MTNITSSNNRPPQSGFHLDKRDAKLFGVCSGLANWSGVDAMWWRLGFVAATLLGFGLAIPIYIVIALIAD